VRSLPIFRLLPVSVLSGFLVATLACTNRPPTPPAVTAGGEAPPNEEAGPAFFTDITRNSNLEFTYRNGEEANHLSILESLGGGVGLIDYNGDGLLDIFLTGGGGFGGESGKEISGSSCRLFKNLGNGKFEDVTIAVGLQSLAGGRAWFYTHGVAVADYDRDGWPDLLVTGWGRVALFQNVPVDPTDPKKGRQFRDVTAAAGLDSGFTWATSAAFGDLDGDGHPDLYVCQYVDWSFSNHPKCSYNEKISDVCPPKRFSGLTHRLFRNTGRGTFVDVSSEAGLVEGGKESSKGLGVLMVDLDGDGKPEIYVANDTTPKFLYQNVSTPGNIRLRELAVKNGAGIDAEGRPNGSMGLDAGDYDGSGRPSLWVTNYEHEQHGLYKNMLRGKEAYFQHQTVRAGIAVMGQKNVGWGTAFIDVNLDGWEDLFVTNGHAIRFPQGASVTRKQPPVLYLNQGGTFRDASRRLGEYGFHNHLGRGVGFGDLDNDGRVDLVISHVNDPVTILRGVGGADRHWIGVSLRGKNHADVVGAKVELQVGNRLLTRFAKGGGSYLSSGDRRLIFGLGDATQTGSVRVTWPDGSKQQIDSPTIDHYHTVIQN